MHLHIDDFSQDCARILLQLYASFPRPSAVYVEDLCGPDQLDEVGLHSKRHLSCLGAMLWLAEEGYLRFGDTIFQEGIEEAVLSRHAFLLLTAPSDPLPAPPPAELPDSVRAERLSLAEQLHEALREGHSPTLKTLVRALLSSAPRMESPPAEHTGRRAP